MFKEFQKFFNFETNVLPGCLRYRFHILPSVKSRNKTSQVGFVPLEKQLGMGM